MQPLRGKPTSKQEAREASIPGLRGGQLSACPLFVASTERKKERERENERERERRKVFC